MNALWLCGRGRRGERAVITRGLWISSITDGATYVKPWQDGFWMIYLLNFKIVLKIEILHAKDYIEVVDLYLFYIFSKILTIIIIVRLMNILSS